ncbi:MAG: hypothetical protein IKS55_13115 [Oscillospiraceae bacterium]|nr:hypothetical protein [Oscillospiraceae bacterium]
MNRIKKKLNSERGASITYALLIFLVCAVVGSAVLVAGTAAAGRMSEVAKSDQRYYAVTSAARLLKDQIDNRPVTIIKEEISSSTTPTYYNAEDRSTPLDADTTFDSIPVQTAYHLMSGSASENTFSLTTDPTHSELDVEISENVSDNGEITIEIAKTKGISNNARTYSMKLLFNLDKSELPPVETKSSTGVVTKTTTTQFTWHLRDIQVVGSQRW